MSIQNDQNILPSAKPCLLDAECGGIAVPVYKTLYSLEQY